MTAYSEPNETTIETVPVAPLDPAHVDDVPWGGALLPGPGSRSAARPLLYRDIDRVLHLVSQDPERFVEHTATRAATPHGLGGRTGRGRRYRGVPGVRGRRLEPHRRPRGGPGHLRADCPDEGTVPAVQPRQVLFQTAMGPVRRAGPILCGQPMAAAKTCSGAAVTFGSVTD